MTDPEYPKKMRHQRDGEVWVYDEPDATNRVPVRDPSGRYFIAFAGNLAPIPSPDDEVEVVVKMTRAQRDCTADRYTSAEVLLCVKTACRAHRDAEADQ